MLNNISELRLLFALCVVVSHSIQLSGFSQYDIIREIFSTELAVQAFFILSGFLVIGSYERSSSINSFYRRRFLRIYPAYLVVVLIFLGLIIIHAFNKGVAVSSSEVIRYLFANLSLLNFLHPGIEGVFAENLYPEINGALWTIKVEVMFYAMVPIIFWLGTVSRFEVVAALMMLCGLLWRPLLGYFDANYIDMHPSLMHQLPGQLHYFAIGILLYRMTKNDSSTRLCLAVFSSGVVLALITGQAVIALQMSSLFGFIYIVSKVKQMPNPIHDIDLSYGVYLIHFPLVQLMIANNMFMEYPLLFLFLVPLVACTLAYISWTCIEKPALTYGSVTYEASNRSA